MGWSKPPREWIIKAEDDGAYAIAVALIGLTAALEDLGNGDASTPMGAIEAFGDHIGNKLDDLTRAIGDLAK